MAARVFDIYDLNSAFVEPTATPAAPAQTATRDMGDRALRGFIGLAILAGALLLAGLLVAATPLGGIDADITVPFLAVCVASLGAIAWAVLK